jgi:DNA invertase Pin-like site-specific DNA recombinase
MKMAARRYVAYYRVSTEHQGRSGLGLEAQRASVNQFARTTSGKLVGEFTEVERGSEENRPQLVEALRLCRLHRAVLLIARLDRLSRSVAMISKLMESGIEFVAVDLPEANRLSIFILAAVAEYETKMISERIKVALAAAKARGGKVGGGFRESCLISIRKAAKASVIARLARAKARAQDLAPILWGLRANGKSLAAIGDELNIQNIATPKKGKWCGSTVRQALGRTAGPFSPTGEAASAANRASRLDLTEKRAAELAPMVWRLRASGKSLTTIAEELNRLGIVTPRKRRWHSSTVFRLLRLTAGAFAPIGETVVAAEDGRRLIHAKARAMALAPIVWELRADGKTHRAIAYELNRRNIRSPRRRKWHNSAVRRILQISAPWFGTADVRIGNHPPSTSLAGEAPGAAGADRAGSLQALANPDAAASVHRTNSADPHRPYVAYFRVSTRRQGWSGLGIESQQEDVRRYLRSMPGKLIAEVTEVENGTRDDRPKLIEALRLCRVHSAILVIARLDRLARNVALISRLMESGVEFVAADCPHANRLTIHILAAIAEYEVKMRSDRLKGACAVEKARGIRRGGNITGNSRLYIRIAHAASNAARLKRAKDRAMDLAPMILELQASGKSLNGIAGELNRRAIESPQGCKWRHSTVIRVLRWTEAASAPVNAAGSAREQTTGYAL